MAGEEKERGETVREEVDSYSLQGDRRELNISEKARAGSQEEKSVKNE